MKKLGGDGQPILHGVVTVEEALRAPPAGRNDDQRHRPYVLRRSPSRGFTPMTLEDMQPFRQRCAPFAADGHPELFKSTKRPTLTRDASSMAIRPRPMPF
jgi:hypothetical protein